MSRALFTAVSGLRNHQVWLDVIGNNIANANTVGYKASTVVFDDILGQTISSGVAPTTAKGGVNPVQVGLGMTIGSISQNFLQGSIQTTNRNTDMAIQGDGFFVLANGTDRTYSRAGSFTLDANGKLVDTATGFKVQGSNGDITIALGSQSTAVRPLPRQRRSSKATSTSRRSTARSSCRRSTRSTRSAPPTP